jgi:HNH endonuclease
MSISNEAEGRFLDSIIWSPFCWTRNAWHDKDGYSKFSWNSWPIPAHRFSWILHYGEIPGGLVVMHKCDNPACVRPDHLALGTQADNIKDRDRKGRTNRWANGVRQGEKSPRAILTEADVLHIRSIPKYQHGYRKSLAERFGVSRKTIDQVRSGISWRHLG